VRILLTNDDGYDAPGLEALRLAIQGLGDWTIVAPLEAQSGCGHRVTTHAPLKLTQPLGTPTFAVNGTPADCVRLAFHQLGSFDLVLSGINAGGNLGADVYISGTVAAAREAAYHGVPAIAFSHYKKRDRDFDWERARVWVRRVLDWIQSRPGKRGEFWNVNFPHLEPGSSDPVPVPCHVSRHPLPLDFVEKEDGWVYSGNYHKRGRDNDCDVATCFGGNIAVSLLTF